MPASNNSASDLPVVSIVTPAYNAEAYIQETIESVLAQDYPRLEYIVIDDGSTDSTPKIIKKYEDRLRFETQENKGQAHTLNKGWSLAHGEILSYLSADDLLFPNAVSTSVQYLQQNPQVVLTYCDYYLIDAASTRFRLIHTPEYDFRDMVVRIVNVPGPAAFFRRTAHESAGPWDTSLRRYPDMDHCMRLGLFGAFQRIPEVLASYRVHMKGIIMSPSTPHESTEAVRIYTKFFQNEKVPQELLQEKNKAMGIAWILDGRTHLRSGRVLEALHSILKAVSLDPLILFSGRAQRLIAFGILSPLGFRRFRRIQ